jgi:hypothetical protein
VWSYDFVFDWCANGQQLKCLTVTDEWTKEGLAKRVIRAVALTPKIWSIWRFEFAGKKIIVGISRVAEPVRLLHRLNSSGPGGRF